MPPSAAILPELPGYRLHEVVHESVRTRVYRGIREGDGAPVVLKMPSPEAELRDVARLRNERDVLTGVQGDGIVQLLADERAGSRLVLVFADSGGAAIRRSQPFSVADFLPLAIQAAQALARVHGEGITHRDLNPSNVIYNAERRRLELIDFGLATTLAEERAAAETHRFEGTLAYLSPEQTGRMNRTVDYRTDFYSLGATFYEMLLGEPPFTAGDPLELVHCHLARRPVPPAERDPAVGPGLSDLIMKLLAKDPDERYQSAGGLIHDLESCRRLQDATGHVERFPLGTRDFTSRLRLPQHLYGRESERRILEAAFQKAARGTPRLIMVHGPAGVGKSTLIGELRASAAQGNGAWVVGKCDEAHRSVPGFCLIQALRERVGQLLAGSPQALERWREALQAALGENGRLVVDAIPDLERIIGPQAAVTELPPAELGNRHSRVFMHFVRALASARAPLVLFLDDVQWADPATLAILEALSRLDDGVHLLLVLGWRDNEVGPEHPLTATLERVQASRTRVDTLALSGLEAEQIGRMLSDTLACTAADAAPLAAVAASKTQGNPFFLRQFLATLHAGGLLRFDPEAHRWTWDAERIRQADITENVADLLKERLRALPAETARALQTAACIGAAFNLSLLGLALDLPPEEVAPLLRPALQEGLVAPVGDGLRLFAAGPQDAEAVRTPAAERAWLQFTHDRIRQAAADLLDAESAMRIHLALGRRLRTHMWRDGRDEDLFVVLSHLHEALALIQEPEESAATARLMLDGARRAMRAAAYGTALAWLTGTLRLLGPAGWRQHRELTLELHMAAATAASMTGDGQAVRSLLGEVLTQARAPVESARALEVWAGDDILHGRHAEALDRARRGLALLGHRLPRHTSRPRLALHLARTTAAVLPVGVERLPDLPQTADPRQQLLVKLFHRAGTAAMLGGTGLGPHCGLSLAELSVRSGITIGSPGAFATLGATLLIGLGRIDLAVRLARAALRLAARFPAEPAIATAEFIANHMILHWKEPMRPIAEWTRGLQRRCIESGDYENGILFAWAYCRMSYQSGVHLEVVRAELASLSALVEDLRHAPAPAHWGVQRRVIDALTGASDGRLDGDGFDGAACLTAVENGGELLTMWTYAFEQAWLHLVFERPLDAEKLLAVLERHLAGMFSLPEVPYYHQLSAMARFAALPQMPEEARPTARRKAERSLSLLRRWARHAPANHAHRAAMVEALRAQADGDPTGAADAFERAAAGAGEHGFLQDEAMALDLAGRFHLSRGRERLARSYLSEARQAWIRWGALARARELDERYPRYASPANAREASMSTSSGGDRPTLDLMTVIKASLAISGEIVLPRLLQRLMAMALENAGAQRGFLVLDRGGRLTVEVEGNVDRDPAVVVASQPLEEATGLALSVVHYVARTRAMVVIDEAGRDVRFGSDEYVRRASPRAILSTPIVSQGKLVGVLYLENNRAASAFTKDRQQVLGVLSVQAAISYENARLYAELDEHRRNLEERVRQRTDELHVKNERLEETLRRLEQAQEQVVAQQKLAYLGGMAAGIAHEIKNPLNFVMNFSIMAAELVEELRASVQEMPADDGMRARLEEGVDGVAEATAKIREHADRIDRVTKAMLLHAGTSSGAREPTDLNTLLSQTVELARSGAADRAVRAVNVSLCLDPDLPRVMAAPRDVARALLNIVTNGMQAAAGTSGARLEVTTSAADGYARITVRDNGPGIPAEVRERIFLPFFTTRPAGQGTGLGLSISWDIIVGQHQGRLGVESEPGHYAEFTIELPIAAT